ncbi:TonB-dependent receptor [Gilvimarinus sp. SDUM040013]|uniref:TonB-dependent receptor n=1 Tax=Gilvimarinus gilvus TaxID=3058038 RepID=A0ABU4S1K4_9GAMM|nr:TonB-dependent receptor [Gilvimarinus sp. SDUM040013]MDO3388064.1 TonB-dependent receptor [Gilvimarinus sp. SDUM040013]MDX6850972.1 TonB-dependent receptor [Gilvimarinus sp. SDUM040013]
MKRSPVIGLSALSLAISAHALAAPQTIEEVLVTADFRETTLTELAASATVIDADTINDRGAKHLAEILNTAPNVNFSAGASRGRFFQIRGIGERSQFVEPVNPSVGLLVDGIDLTGLGGAATTLDINQVEILRGPQGTTYGANALAGLINMVSAAPTEEFSGEVAATIGNYNSYNSSVVLSGPMTDTLGWRVALEQNTSDGYQDNAYLGVDDNANIDEQTARAKLRWQPADATTLDITGLYVNVDNGYDGFSLDNTRTTLSDQPGHDRIETLAGSARLQTGLSDKVNLVALLSHAQSDTEYGYDEDWAYTDICVDFTCIYDGYNSFDNYQRDIDNTTADLRLVSSTQAGELGWVAGVYYRDQNEDLARQYTYLASDFGSNFSAESTAVYGELDIPLATQLTLVTGLRYEERSASYSDSDGVSFEPSDDMLGGKVALEYRLQEGQLLYALASRGYKAGGFNSNSDIPANDREYQPEFLWNYELGGKFTSQDGTYSSRVAFFYQDRDEVQTKQSLVQNIEGENCPCRFVDYTTNAAAGTAYGLEAEINWQLSDALSVFTSLGLLRSEFNDFASYAHSGANDETGEPYDLSGHDLPHAPRYQFTVGGEYFFTDHLYARLEVEGKDSFYFSSRHEAQSEAYELINARIGYTAERWEVALWGRNLSDEDTLVRGFGSFGNDPRKGYATEPYSQYGEPRVLGVSAKVRF